MEPTYMQQYYAKNKDVLKSKLMAKVICPTCKRTISHGFLNKHKTMDICRRNQQTTAPTSLEDKIKHLEEKLNILTKNNSSL